MSKQGTKYMCIKSLTNSFTVGIVYTVIDYPTLIPTGIEFIDNTGRAHTITARLFGTLFTEYKAHE